MKREHEELCARLDKAARVQFEVTQGRYYIVAFMEAMASAAIRELSAEVDALFTATKCECEQIEFCANLVKHIDRAERAEAELASLQERLKDAEKEGFKAGMRRAATLLDNRFLPRPSVSMEDVAYNTSLRSAIDAILAEADK